MALLKNMIARGYGDARTLARLGNGAQVCLGSAELAAVCAQLGQIPSKEEYLASAAEKINPDGAELYGYLNCDEISGFEDSGQVVSSEEEAKVLGGLRTVRF